MMLRRLYQMLFAAVLVVGLSFMTATPAFATCDGWAAEGTTHRNAGNGCYYKCSNGSWGSPERCDGQGNGECQGCGQASREDAERAVRQRQREAEQKIQQQGGINSAATRAVQQETAQKFGAQTGATPRDDDPLADAAGQVGEDCDPNSGSAGSVGPGGRCCIGGVVECGDDTNGSCSGGINRFGTYGTCGAKLVCGDGLASANECSAPNVCPRDYRKCEEQGFTAGTGANQEAAAEEADVAPEVERYDKLVQECLFSDLQLEEGTLDAQCVQRLSQASANARAAGVENRDLIDRRRTLGAYYTATYNAARAEVLCAEETAECEAIQADAEAAVQEARNNVRETFGDDVLEDADQSAASYRSHIGGYTGERIQAAQNTDQTMSEIEARCANSENRERCLRIEMRVKLGLDLDEDGDVVVAEDSSFNQQFCSSPASQGSVYCGNQRVSQANQALSDGQIQIELDEGTCGFQGGCECEHYGGAVQRGGRCYPDSEEWVDSRDDALTHTGCGADGQAPCNGQICDNADSSVRDGICTDVEDELDLPYCEIGEPAPTECLCGSQDESLRKGETCLAGGATLVGGTATTLCTTGEIVSSSCYCQTLDDPGVIDAGTLCPNQDLALIERNESLPVCTVIGRVESDDYPDGCSCDGVYTSVGDSCYSLQNSSQMDSDFNASFGDLDTNISLRDDATCEIGDDDCVILGEDEVLEDVAPGIEVNCPSGLEPIAEYDSLGNLEQYSCTRTESLLSIANDVPCTDEDGCICQSSGLVVAQNVRCPSSTSSVQNACVSGKDTFQNSIANSTRCALGEGEAFQCIQGYSLRNGSCTSDSLFERWTDAYCGFNNRLPGCPGYVVQLTPGQSCTSGDTKQCNCVGGEFVGNYCAAPQVIGIGERCRFPENPALCECPRGELVNGACYPPEQNSGCFMQAGSVECREGFEYRCEGSWYNGSWQFTGQTCDNDACVPGTFICDGTTGVKLCKSDGSGWIERDCAAGLVCAGGRCSAQCEQTNQILGENRVVTTGPSNQCVLFDEADGTAQRAQECETGTRGCTYGDDSTRWACVPDEISCQTWWGDCNNSGTCEEDNQQVYLCGEAGNESYCQSCGGPNQIACDCENDYNWSCTLNRPEWVPSLRGDMTPTEAFDVDYQCVQSPLTSDVYYVCQECGGAGQAACVASDGQTEFMVLEAIPGAQATDLIDQDTDLVEYSSQATVYRCDNIASVMSTTPNRVCAPYCGGSTGVACPAQPASNHGGVFTRDVSGITGENVDPSIRYELSEDPIPGFSFGY